MMSWLGSKIYVKGAKGGQGVFEINEIVQGRSRMGPKNAPFGRTYFLSDLMYF